MRYHVKNNVAVKIGLENISLRVILKVIPYILYFMYTNININPELYMNLYKNEDLKVKFLYNLKNYLMLYLFYTSCYIL